MNEIGDALGIQHLDRRKLESIAKDVETIVKNPPTMTCVNIFLNDSSALKHAIIKKIIIGCTDITDTEADWYLLMKGVEEEMKKLSVLGVKLENEPRD